MRVDPIHGATRQVDDERRGRSEESGRKTECELRCCFVRVGLMAMSFRRIVPEYSIEKMVLDRIGAMDLIGSDVMFLASLTSQLVGPLIMDLVFLRRAN